MEVSTKLNNPYLEECLKRKKDNYHESYSYLQRGLFEVCSFDRTEMANGIYIDPRRSLIEQYSWAIPTEEVIKKIVEWSPIIEIGAGLGYWASLVDQLGGQIKAYDSYSEGWESYEDLPKHFKVERMGEIDLDYSDTLFLCWPPYAEDMAETAIRMKKWTRIIFVGEGAGGCTGNDEFHEILENEYEEVDYMKIPVWEGIHDGAYFYQAF